MKDVYDVIVIGGGINGLTVAAYMAKCGQSVAVFESRNEVGTNCDTEEVMMPGVRCNLHASGITPWMAPAYEELELERFGLEMITGHWGYFKPFKDGTVLCQHNYDFQKTCQSIDLISKKDGDTCRKIGNYFAQGTKLVDLFESLFYTPPNPKSFAKVAEIISGVPGMPSNWSDMTGYHIADMLFESDKLKCMIYDGMLEVAMSPWLKGIGSMGVVLFLFTGMGFPWASTTRGGSHGLPHSLYRSLLHYGGEVYQACPVTKIIVENGEAKGIVLGEESVYGARKIMAKKAVVSNLTTQPTFLWLVGEENLSPEVAMAARMYDNEGEVLFTNYYAMTEPLNFKMFEWSNKNLDPSFQKEAYMFNFGMEDPADYTRLMHCIARGELPDPPIVVGGCFNYTTIDPTQAPDGMHTVLTWANVPYNIRCWGDRKLKGPEDWDEIKEEYADLVENMLAEYAPNIKTAVVDRYVHTPLDNTRRNQSQLSGSFSGGPCHIHQFYHNRPFPGCGAPRTPIKKLYITEVTWARATYLLGGYNAAVVLGEDLGVRNQPWWNVRCLEPYIRWCKRNGREWRIA